MSAKNEQTDPLTVGPGYLQYASMLAMQNTRSSRVVVTSGVRFLLLFWIGIVSSLPAFAVNPPEPFLRAPYLQMGGPNLMHVVWRTMGPIEPVVRYGTDPKNLSERIRGNAMTTRVSLGTNGQPILERWKALRTSANLGLPKLHSAPVGAFQYEAKISDLKPSTRYYYAVYDGDKRLTAAEESYQFITHPPVGTVQPVRFWALGDGGTGREAQKAVHDAMNRVVQKEEHPLDFVIHMGDMAYGTGRDVEFTSRFFEAYESTLRNKVCWPTMGNHEGYTSKGTTGIGPYYDAYVVPTRAEVGGVASGTEAYYSFDYANIHFICLDSHDLDRKPTATMAKWLKADLEKAKADWLIAFWHHPAYTKGNHDSDKEKDLTEMRQNIMPIIEAGGVDLVLCGHSHIYERSMLLDGAYAATTVAENVVIDDGDGDPTGDGAYRKSSGIHPHEGTVQVVAGNAGQTLGRSGTMPVMRKILLEHGSVIVDVHGDTLLARMINRNGNERDLFSIVKRGTAAPNRIAHPWQPAEYKKPTNEAKDKAAPAFDHKIVIPAGDTWEYLSGNDPRGMDWTRLGFNGPEWKTGTAGFGFGEADYKTELKEMRRSHTSLYVRKEFTVPQADRVTELGLWINYEDAFIAYINGREVARQGVGRGNGRNAQSIKEREEHGKVYITLKDTHQYLQDGKNVIAIEGHLSSNDKLDFVLDPSLVLED